MLNERMNSFTWLVVFQCYSHLPTLTASQGKTLYHEMMQYTVTFSFTHYLGCGLRVLLPFNPVDGIVVRGY